MSEPFAERLSRFTPDAAGLDRAALLFEAGRAAARPAWRWKALAAVLTSSQLLTLWLLWSRTSPPSPSPVERPPVLAPVAPPGSGEGTDPSGLWTLNRRLREGQGDATPRAIPVDKLAPDPPPLHAVVSLASPLFD